MKDNNININNYEIANEISEYDRNSRKNVKVTKLLNNKYEGEYQNEKNKQEIPSDNYKIKYDVNQKMYNQKYIIMFILIKIKGIIHKI